MNKDQLVEWTITHSPTNEEVLAMQAIRDATYVYLRVLDNYVHDCADKTAAFRKIREAMMTCNFAVVCHEPK